MVRRRPLRMRNSAFDCAGMYEEEQEQEFAMSYNVFAETEALPPVIFERCNMIGKFVIH